MKTVTKAFARPLVTATMAIAFAFGALGSCGSTGKPNEKECQAAIENMQKILGTSKVDVGADPRRAVRSCQGNSSKRSVRCFANAKDREELLACEGKTGEKYFEEEKKLESDRQRKVDEKEASESEGSEK